MNNRKYVHVNEKEVKEQANRLLTSNNFFFSFEYAKDQVKIKIYIYIKNLLND